MAHTSIRVTRLMRAFHPLRTDSQIGTKFNSWPLNHSSAAAVEGAISGFALLHYRKILNGVLKVMPSTGFLVGIRAIVTNYHCIDSNKRAITAEVYFDFDEPGGMLPPSPIRVLRAIVLDPSLDLAVLELEEAPTRAVSRVLTLSGENYVAVNTMLRIIHHYQGQHKEVSYDSNCKSMDIMVNGSDSIRAPMLDFTHGCDTDKSSSGSPVLEQGSGNVVGLHHYGVVPGGQFTYNRAVSIGFVIKRLKKLSSTQKGKALEGLNIASD